MYFLNVHKEIGNFKDNYLSKCTIEEEGSYKLILKNTTSSNFVKQGILTKIYAKGVFEKTETIEKEFIIDFILSFSQLPCNIQIEMSSNSLIKVQKSFELLIFQKYEKIKEYTELVDKKKEFNFKLKCGIYRLIVENRGKSKLLASFKSLAFSFGDTEIIKENPFISHPFAVALSMQPLEATIFCSGNSTVHVAIVKYSESEKTVLEMESKESYKKALEKAIKDKEILKITELLQGKLFLILTIR